MQRAQINIKYMDTKPKSRKAIIITSVAVPPFEVMFLSTLNKNSRAAQVAVHLFHVKVV